MFGTPRKDLVVQTYLLWYQFLEYMAPVQKHPFHLLGSGSCLWATRMFSICRALKLETLKKKKKPKESTKSRKLDPIQILSLPLPNAVTFRHPSAPLSLSICTCEIADKMPAQLMSCWSICDGGQKHIYKIIKQRAHLKYNDYHLALVVLN